MIYMGKHKVNKYLMNHYMTPVNIHNQEAHSYLVQQYKKHKQLQMYNLYKDVYMINMFHCYHHHKM
jgi:hypothetical protein